MTGTSRRDEGDEMGGAMPSMITAVDGFLVGPERTPRNVAGSARRGAPNGPGAEPGRRPGTNIHDDDTAQRLGFRGGTVAGSVHLDQFPPVLMAAFGQRWFAQGSLSLGFINATLDAEPVIAMVRLPEERAQVEARMERRDGLLVAAGTAGCGETDPTHLHSVDLHPSPSEELRLLSGVEVGAPIARRTFRVDSADQRSRIEQSAITEPLDFYVAPSPWGPPIVNPSSIVQRLRNGPGDFGPHVAEAVGLFGAIELRFSSGPLLCDTEYEVSGEVAAVGSSPRTEYVWYDSRAIDDRGNVAVSMRMQLRWMKASSPMYQEPSP